MTRDEGAAPADAAPATEPPPAAVTPPDPASSRAGIVFREYLEVICLAALFALFAKTFVFEGFEIPTPSMEDNLLVGDHIFVNKFVYAKHDGPWARFLPHQEPERGDVFVFKSPEQPERDFVKRLVGAPGDRIEVVEKELRRNGAKVKEPWVVHRDPGFDPSRDDAGPVTVPPASFFAMGDNRDDSRDSRYWGFVPRELVKGRALVVYWSFDSSPQPSPARGAGLSRFLDTAIHFLKRTRWERTLHVVR